METVRYAISRLVRAVRRNPVLVGAVVVAGQALLAGDPWRAVLTTLVGVVVRAFVTPETAAKTREAVAYTVGRMGDLPPWPTD